MTENLTIDITTDGLVINGVGVKKPLSFKEVCAVLGEPVKHENTVVKNLTYGWEDKGIRCFVIPDTDTIHRLDIIFNHRPGSKLSFMETFTGTVTVNSQALIDSITQTPDDFGMVEEHNGEMNFELLINTDAEPKPEMLMIEGAVSEKPAATVVEPLVPVKAEVPIAFKDFNFKLAVIQELMFGDTPVLPAFRLSQFVAGYKDRSINIATEGDAPIPEVVEFFKAYEVDQKYAPLVTELYLDGGNEIYMEIAPYFSGEEPLFDIEDFSDATSFPNLNKITNELFPLSAEQKTRLDSLNIAY